MSTLNLLPLIAAIAIIGGAVQLFRYMGKKNVFSSFKRVRFLFWGYGVILVLGTVLAVFVPEQGIKAGEKVGTDILQKEVDDLHTNALEGKPDEKWKRKSWSFVYHGEVLNIAVPENGYSDMMIVTDRKAENDGKIEAHFYQTRASMNDRAITTKRIPINVKVDGNNLLIEPQKVQLTYRQFTNVFSVKQFTGEKVFSHSSFFFEGESVLYLKIPKDLQVIPQENLHFENVIK